MPLALQDETAALIARATRLHADLAGVLAESRALIARGRERRFTSTYPRLRLIRGGSDIALLATVLSIAPLCPDCIARKTGVPGDRIDAVVGEISSTLQLEIGPSRCRLCLEERPVTYRLATTLVVTGAAAHPSQAGLWRFLEQHRGQMFCTACLAEALGTTTPIDRLIMAAEGNGAGRSYTRCAVCGRERLACGLAAN